MAALLQNLAVGQHDDVVGVLDGGQPVGYDQHRADRAHLFQRILNQDLGLGVDVCRGFVQNHDTGLVQDRPRKAQQLPLPGREVVAALADLLVQTVVKLGDKLVGVHIAADPQDLLIRDALLPQDDVAADRTREKEHILQHLPEMAAQRGNLDLADVDAVNQDLAPLELIVAADQRQNRAFAGAGGPHKRHRLTRVYMEGDALQHPLAGYVAEPDIPEFDFAPHLFQLDGIGGVHHLRLDVHEREHLFRGGQRRLQPVELLGQILDGGEELGDVHVKGHDGAAGDGLAQKR